MPTPTAIFEGCYPQQDLWRPELIDEIADQLPTRWLTRADMLLLLVEVIANAAIHGKTTQLCVRARVRHPFLLISFQQDTPLHNDTSRALTLAKANLPADEMSELPYGLGFRIMVKLAHRVTLSPDRQSVQIWLKSDTEWANLVFGQPAG